MPSNPANVVIREVGLRDGLRDGLQSIQRILPTERKIEWIDDAYAAGQREIEVGSFVPARLLPQLADTAELVAYAKTVPGLFVSVLVRAASIASRTCARRPRKSSRKSAACAPHAMPPARRR